MWCCLSTDSWTPIRGEIPSCWLVVSWDVVVVALLVKNIVQIILRNLLYRVKSVLFELLQQRHTCVPCFLCGGVAFGVSLWCKILKIMLT